MDGVKITLIVFGIILAIILTTLLVQYILIKNIKKQLKYSHYFVDNEVGYITYICGTVGAGKTTLGCGITNYLNETLIKKAIDIVKSFTTIYYDFDFNKAYDIVNQQFDLKNYNANTITKIVLKDDQYKILGNMFYSNYMKDRVPTFKQLEGFIDALLSLIRYNYVYYYHRGFYSHITNKYAYDFTPDMIEIKDRAISKDYKIFTYSIIFEDEKQLSNKINTNFHQIAKEDAGSDMFLRLIRQLGKGTIYYLTTSQEFTRAVKVERALATSILYITKRRTINPYFIKTTFYRFIEWFFKFIYRIKNKILKRKDLFDGYLYKSNIVKRIIFKINQQQKKLYSKIFLEYTIIKYNSAEDVGKRKEIATYGAEETKLTFPIKYCFGSIDTYAFSSIQDYLINDSTSLQDIDKKPTQNEDFAKSVLEKKINKTTDTINIEKTTEVVDKKDEKPKKELGFTDKNAKKETKKVKKGKQNDK